MSNGSELWMKNKNLHREDGPAIYRTTDNFSAYYLEGSQLSFESWVCHPKVLSHMTPKKLTFTLIKYGSN